MQDRRNYVPLVSAMELASGLREYLNLVCFVVLLTLIFYPFELLAPSFSGFPTNRSGQTKGRFTRRRSLREFALKFFQLNIGHF
jgi:hypothetical protein